jgi:hypothetical protein
MEADYPHRPAAIFMTYNRKRTPYNTYDISKYLHSGTNCVGVWMDHLRQP